MLPGANPATRTEGSQKSGQIILDGESSRVVLPVGVLSKSRGTLVTPQTQKREVRPTLLDAYILEKRSSGKEAAGHFDREASKRSRGNGRGDEAWGGDGSTKTRRRRRAVLDCL